MVHLVTEQVNKKEKFADGVEGAAKKAAECNKTYKKKNTSFNKHQQTVLQNKKMAPEDVMNVNTKYIRTETGMV